MRKRVLFICVHNSARSQIADAWLNKLCSENCPTFPGPATRFHWTFPDPSQVPGGEAAKFNRVQVIRDQIRQKIESWCEEISAQAATSPV